MEPAETLPLLRTLASRVARAVRAAPLDALGRDIGMGADGTATKLVDDVAERAILEALDAADAPLDVLSEEAGLVRRGGTALLVADPVDGTTNAARGIPFYCTSLAVGRRTLADVETGLVLNLATGDRYEAVRGGGATLFPGDGRPPRRLDARAGAGGAVVGVALGSSRDAASRMPQGASVLRCLGAAALEMSLVAQGALDAYHYPRAALRTTDVAAACLIVREAGGVVLDANGNDLDLPLTLEPRFGVTAAARRDLATALGVPA